MRLRLPLAKKENKLKMRIISGKFRGRRLVSFQADNIRPTTDRVKETLFNKLMGLVDGARVLDLFSGTGNLAIECLSRGAAHVDLVENHRKSLEIVKKNFNLLNITEGFKVYPVDAFKFIQSYQGPPYDLIIADPPFTQSFGHDLCLKIGESATLGPAFTYVVETSSKERMDESYPGLNRLDRREFGDKHLNFFEKATEIHGQGDLPR
jgi:16S rRNA (guanine966-N2)-methyltransferase